ncbi:MAG: hypothetical protein MK172_08710 [Verrucomicrobiales bacterium]|nr:hypothetical protein [Verrucomicrobiales bacterium]
MGASDYNYNQLSQTNDLLMEIIKDLGEKIGVQTGTNPDAQFEYRFVASDYNKGNLSQTDDLLEEIIERLNDWNGGGGGGGADGNDSIKITANDTTAGFLFDKLGYASSEILFHEVGDGGAETLKLLSQLATRVGEKAMVGTVTGGAKWSVHGELGIDVAEYCLQDGSSSLRIDEDGNKIFTAPNFSEGNIVFAGDTILYKGNNLSTDPRIRFNGTDIILQSNSGRMFLFDKLHFNSNASVVIDGTTVWALAEESYGVSNAMRVQTGMVFSRTTIAEPHITFRTDGVINMDGQESGAAGTLYLSVAGENKHVFDDQGNYVYIDPQYTGYANAAAVQADAAITQGTLCELTDGTIVRKQ